METLERILAVHPFFEELDKRHLEILVGCASNVRFEQGKPIFREGEEAEQFFLIREGKVVLEQPTPRHGPIVIDTLRAGEVLGWSWLIPPYRWRFNARAIEPVRAIALDGKCLRGKCESDHDLGFDLLKRFAHITADRLQATRMQLLHIHEAWSDLTDGRT